MSFEKLEEISKEIDQDVTKIFFDRLRQNEIDLLQQRISRMQTYLKDKIFECYEAHNSEKAHEYEDILIELNK